MCLAGGSNSEKACAERAHQRNSKDGMGGAAYSVKPCRSQGHSKDLISNQSDRVILSKRETICLFPYM